MESIKYIQFGTLTGEQWSSFSVVEINKPSSQGGADKNLSHTPYDEHMGAIENGKTCQTCREFNDKCPGHFGHIRLPVPIYNRQFIDVILKILQCVCPHCARPRILPDHISLQNSRLRRYKRLKALVEKCAKIRNCPWETCGQPLPSFDNLKNDIRRHYGEKKKAVTFSAGEALGIFFRIKEEHLSLLGLNDGLSDNEVFSSDDYLFSEEYNHVHQIRPESLIFTVLPVIPPLSRPYVIRDGQKCDDDLTDKYNDILKHCIKLREDEISCYSSSNSKNRRKFKKLSEADREKTIALLQDDIWALMNNKDEKSKLSSGGRRRAHKCLFQRIQGKEGHVQSNVGGKRVDFSARSVIIGGGTMLRMDELGVPKCIAEELTRPFKAKEWNIEYLQTLMSRGKINRVIRKGRGIIIIRKNDFCLQIDDTVERQLQDGDILIFNRQPTLRLESMTAFKVKVIDGYAFRLSLWATPGFNADKTRYQCRQQVAAFWG